MDKGSDKKMEHVTMYACINSTEIKGISVKVGWKDDISTRASPQSGLL